MKNVEFYQEQKCALITIVNKWIKEHPVKLNIVMNGK